MKFSMVRFIKLFIISAVVLFLLLTTLAALLPSEVRISRAIDIRRPQPEVYKEMSSLVGWEQWNLYVSTMNQKAVFADSIIGKELSIRIQQRKPGVLLTGWRDVKGRSFTGGFQLIPHDSVTTVQWYFDFHFKWYPWEKFSSIVYDQQIGPTMQQSLQNLKSVIENVH
jgi:hypothetical protein